MSIEKQLATAILDEFEIRIMPKLIDAVVSRIKQDEKRVYTAAEAAKVLKCTSDTVRKMVRDGRLEACQATGKGCLLVSQKSIDKYIEEFNINNY